jgi:excisionase family DNA binding protein
MLLRGTAMRRTKKPAPELAQQPQALSAVNGAPSDVLTLAEVAAYLRLTEGEVLRLVDEQGLPARQLGKERRFLKAAIQQWLGAGTPVAGKEAQLAVAGAWKDDPLVEEELRETYRRRGCSLTAEDS